MSSDLETQLINGGLGPVAAKVISNAISNAYSGKVNLGRHVEDATPEETMRLITSDARRYLLTNLDYAGDKRANPSARFSPRTTKHPYQDSQPASANPTVSTPQVRAGKYIAVSAQTTNDVAQSEVTLRVSQRGGTHARLNPATGEIESVPFLIEVDPQNKVEAVVEERSNATVLKLRFLS